MIYALYLCWFLLFLSQWFILSCFRAYTLMRHKNNHKDTWLDKIILAPLIGVVYIVRFLKR